MNNVRSHAIALAFNLQTYKSVLSNELLYVLVSQGAAKISEVKVKTESQGHGMTFNVIYVRSKYPYFISYGDLC